MTDSLHPDLGSSFWGMALIVASANLISARIAAGCLAVALLIVLFIAKNVRMKEHLFKFSIHKCFFQSYI